MMVGGGVDEELGSEEPRPVDEWPPPTSNVELTNKDGTSSRLLFLTVQYVGDDAGSSYNPGTLETFSELEQRVVSPLDPNMGCTACYSPVYTPAPVSPSNGYLNPPSPSPASCLPESDMIVLSDQCQFSTGENYVVTTRAQDQESHDDNKLLLLSTDTTQPTELVVAGGQTCTDQRVELLLSNGTIAYGIVESTDDAGTRVIQIPREYLVGSRTQHTVLSQELENEQNDKVQHENGQDENVQVENVQDENGHLRDIYSTLKEQGLIIEPGHIGMQTDLDQSQLESTLLDQTSLPQEHMSSPVFSDLQPQRRFWCEECNVLLDSDCREHQINRKINDKAVPSRARATLPASYLAINKLDPEVEVYGVFARKSIPKRTQFGPIEGVIIKSEDILLVTQSPNLVLSIETDTGDLRTLDVSNEHMSNWMRFVRMATPDRLPNLLLSQLGASLFFTTTQTIHPREELLVWYSPTYATRRNLPPNPPSPEWLCSTCGIKLKTLDELNKHSDCHKDNSVREENLTVSTLRRKNQALVSFVSKDIAERNVNNGQKMRFECAICNKRFPRSYSLRRHILLLHTRENKYHCKICHLGFSHSYNRLRHMRKSHPHHKDVKPLKDVTERYESWTCTHCELTFTSASILNLHTLVHAAKNVEDNMMDLPDDIEDAFHKPEELVSCPQCAMKFSNKHKLANHVTEHGKNRDPKSKKKFHCGICGRNFMSAVRFQIHCEVHGNDDKKPLQCDVCKKRLLTKSALSCHLKVHECSVQWECPMCEEHFGNMLALKSHVHSHAVRGFYHCPQCGKKFEEYSGVRKHIRAFHSERKHGCEICGKQFPSQDKLRMHLLRHSDHREFLCSDCGKQFKRKDKLKEHMRRLHSDNKEVEVIVEEKLTSAEKKTITKIVVNSSDYERYIFKCHACMLGFKRRGMLVNHLANRHPEITPDSVPELNLPILKTTRDYFCQYCDKIYKSSSKRKAHILKNHPGLELPMSNRQKGGVPEIPGLPNPTFSQTVGSITTNPHGCQWCHKQYASKAKLLQHQRKKHVDRLVHSDQMTQPLKNLAMEENIEKGVCKKKPKTRSTNYIDASEGEPIPVALATNMSNPVTNLGHLQEYEIIETEDDVAANSILIDTSSMCKRSSCKNDNISSDLLSQAMSEIGVSLSDLRALSSEQYLKILQSPSGLVVQDPLYTSYIAR